MKTVFDGPRSLDLLGAKTEFVGRWMPAVISARGMRTAVDIGCGVGLFTSVLAEQGLSVIGMDCREANVIEARKRYPAISFHAADIDDHALKGHSFDLVVAFGLLYHLENPFRTIHHLHSLTGQMLLIESIVAPRRGCHAILVDEPAGEDQGIRHTAFIPTQDCLVKMLYRAGFKTVCGIKGRPRHPDFHKGVGGWAKRVMLVAGDDGLHESGLFAPIHEPSSSYDLWSGRKSWERLRAVRGRMWQRG